jgi:parallel beta-helix repeat protein
LVNNDLFKNQDTTFMIKKKFPLVSLILVSITGMVVVSICKIGFNDSYAFYPKQINDNYEMENSSGDIAAFSDRETKTNNKASGKIYYVDSASGNDTNLGTTQKLALQTIQQANQRVAAGDTVYVKNGTYNENIIVKSSGRPQRWITFQAFPGHKPAVVGTNQAFSIEGSYIKIMGFNITSKAENGIAIGGEIGGNHHTQIVGNIIHDSGCNAIGGMRTDYLLIANNTVYRNAFTAPWQCSGISIYQAQKFDDKPGFHNIVRGNISYSNENKLLRKNGTVTDGNGIIIDDFRHTQQKTPQPKYTAWTLVENNITFDNGGRGIHVFQSDNVVVRNNTTFHNLKSNTLEGSINGEITTYYSSRVGFYNNIAHARDKSKKTFSDGYSSDNKWEYNMSFNGQVWVGKDNSNAKLGRGNVIDIDPLFVRASIIPSKANFRLKANSPAVNAGTSTNAASIDINAQKRPLRAKYDMGAYEMK